MCVGFGGKVGGGGRILAAKLLAAADFPTPHSTLTSLETKNVSGGGLAPRLGENASKILIPEIWGKI